jgi:hypothetical protein
VVPVEAADLWAGNVLPELWEDVFLPPRALWLRQATPLDELPWNVRLEGRGLVFSSAKPPEEGRGLVLRCWNARPDAVAGAWRFARPVTSAVRLRADEAGGSAEALPLADRGRVIPLAVGPHGLATVRVEVAP